MGHLEAYANKRGGNSKMTGFKSEDLDNSLGYGYILITVKAKLGYILVDEAACWLKAKVEKNLASKRLIHYSEGMYDLSVFAVHRHEYSF